MFFTNYNPMTNEKENRGALVQGVANGGVRVFIFSNTIDFSKRG